MRRFNQIVESAGALLLCASGVSVGYVWKTSHLALDNVSIVLLVPSIATILYVLISIAAPAIYSVDGLRFPLNITLPVIHCALLVVTLILVRQGGLSISRVPDQLSSIHVWEKGWVLGFTFASGVIFLSLLGWFGKGTDDRNDPDQPRSTE